MQQQANDNDRIQSRRLMKDTPQLYGENLECNDETQL